LPLLETTEPPQSNPSWKFFRFVARIVAYVVGYLVILAPSTYFVYNIPSTPLGDNILFKFWYNSFQWGKMVLWCSTLAFGFTFVSWVTERRAHPFKKTSEFFKLVASSPFLFFARTHTNVERTR